MINGSHEKALCNANSSIPSEEPTLEVPFQEIRGDFSQNPDGMREYSAAILSKRTKLPFGISLYSVLRMISLWWISPFSPFSSILIVLFGHSFMLQPLKLSKLLTGILPKTTVVLYCHYWIHHLPKLQENTRSNRVKEIKAVTCMIHFGYKTVKAKNSNILMRNNMCQSGIKIFSLLMSTSLSFHIHF